MTFVLQKGKVRANGKAPNVARIIDNGEMAHFSTQQTIEPDRWDAAASRTLGQSAEEKSVNRVHEGISAAVHRHYFDLQGAVESFSALKLKKEKRSP